MQILNSNSADVETIFHFYDLAVEFQKTKFDKHWLAFDKELIEKEVSEKRQWKILIEDKVACIFAVTYNDPEIWKERDRDPAVYIHRIVTHPLFRGRQLVKAIIGWAKEHAVSRSLSFIRMDTWGDNQPLIDYYISCGFTFLGTVVPDASGNSQNIIARFF